MSETENKRYWVAVTTTRHELGYRVETEPRFDTGEKPPETDGAVWHDVEAPNEEAARMVAVRKTRDAIEEKIKAATPRDSK